MDNELLMGGLWCHEVLDLLGDYLDGELSAERRAQVDAHLRGCGNCARFGADVAGMLGALSKGKPEVWLPAEVSERLRRALRDIA